jgi:glutaredoxin 3
LQVRVLLGAPKNFKRGKMNIVIYTKKDCSYCVSAKQFLEMKNMSYQEKVLGEDFTRETLLEAFPNAKTFPVIVVDGFNIGGYNEMTKYINENFTNKGQKFLFEGEWNGN